MRSKPPPHIEKPQSDSDSDSDSSTQGSEEKEQIEDTSEDENPISNSNAKSNPPQNSAPEWEASESDGSGSDSDSPRRNRSHVKPVKRKLETEEKSSKEPKKKKVSELEPKKKLTREEMRVWTDEDEIVLLKGMVNIIHKRGMDTSHVSEIFDSIHHLFGPNIKRRRQLVAKINSLKHRYHKTLRRLGPAEADPWFPTPHAAKVYQLSKKVWGKDHKRQPNRIQLAAEESGSEEGESESESKAAKMPHNFYVAREKQAPSQVNEKPNSESISTFLNASILARDLPIPPPGLGEFFQKEGWNLMGTSTAKRLDKRWKNVVTAEAKAYLERISLVREQTQVMLDMLQSTDL